MSETAESREDFKVAIRYGAVEPSRRRIYRTAQIKPATRDAIKDVLAQAADEIIALRTKLAAVKPPLWARFFRGALTLWTGA